MDKSSAQNPRGLLQVNGPISPPLTPDLNGNAMGIMEGTNGTSDTNYTNISFHLRRPDSPQSSVSSVSHSASSPTPRPASTFTATSYTDSQPAGLERKDSHPIPPYGIHESDPPPHSSTRAKIRTYTDGRNDRAFPRLSKPVELLRSEYDVVVIGSGYGGGIAASRMARTGESVCLLERGHERWPGEYPSGSIESIKELHYSGALAPGPLKGKLVEGGDPTGMFHLIMGRGQSAVVGNGEFNPSLSS